MFFWAAALGAAALLAGCAGAWKRPTFGSPRCGKHEAVCSQRQAAEPRSAPASQPVSASKPQSESAAQSGGSSGSGQEAKAAGPYVKPPTHARRPSKPAAGEKAPARATAAKPKPKETAGPSAPPPKPRNRIPSGPGEIAIRWTTEQETEVSGFNILRSDSPRGPWRRVNSETVGAAGRSTTPRSYEYIDRDVQSGKTYYYFLEEVLANGERRMKSGLLSGVARPAE